MTQASLRTAQSLRTGYLALQRGAFAEARDATAPHITDASCALIHAIGLAGAGAVEPGAAALAAIARANPAAQHPTLDLVAMLQAHAIDPAPHLEAALRHMPGHPTLLTARGGLNAETGSIDAAIAAFAEVAGNRPHDPAVLSNLGKALAAAGRFPEATGTFAQAVALPGASPQIRLNQAVATLKSGDLPTGWPQFRARHDLPDRAAPPPGPELRTLDAVAGQTILLVHHEGFGDTIQFIRYAPLLAKLGARVAALVPKELVRLLRHNGIDAATSAPGYDTWCYVPDLPGLFGTTIATIPPTRLQAAPDLVGHWQARLPPRSPGRPNPRSRARIGLVWAGAARRHDPAATATDRLRSLTPAHLAPLLALPDIDWINLQHAAAPPPGVFDPMPAVTDFADTAAIIDNLDGVVSVDTSVVHLAASLGRPVLLLDRYDNCWRWLHGRTDSPWYPGMIRIIRQPAPGDWAPVLTEAAKELAALASTI